MRPQHITAENPDGPVDHRGGITCFNEAAAYHCGKRRVGGALWVRRYRCFNEAAAYHCGKRAGGRAKYERLMELQ